MTRIILIAFLDVYISDDSFISDLIKMQVNYSEEKKVKHYKLCLYITIVNIDKYMRKLYSMLSIVFRLTSYIPHQHMKWIFYILGLQ